MTDIVTFEPNIFKPNNIPFIFKSSIFHKRVIDMTIILLANNFLLLFCTFEKILGLASNKIDRRDHLPLAKIELREAS